MCRLAAYIGEEIPLEQMIVQPRHSLLEQSHHANEAKLSVNGDGFGFAWYFGAQEPGLYRDVLPAWSDGNLSSLCRAVSAPLFLAHVRASTEGEVIRTNCHPFVYQNWSFAHNGRIGGFSRIRRSLEASLPDLLYHRRRGTTDSELFFLLLLSNGLCDDVLGAVRLTLDVIRKAQNSVGGVGEPNRLTCIFSDGTRVYGLRTACDGRSPTLYFSDHPDFPGTLLASEPLDGRRDQWTRVGQNRIFVMDRCGTREETL